MNQNHPFAHLLEPINIHGVELRNRAIMGSMHTGLEDQKKHTHRLAQYFAERAKGEIGLIITGGIAPHWRGVVAPFSATLTRSKQIPQHQVLTRAVHSEGGKICMQILHAGRYAYHPFAVAPSRIKAPISPFKPWALSSRQIDKLINQFAHSARLAQEAGYDGVEIMGSEGYLINEFLVSHTNKRKDKWGGTFQNRTQFAIDIVEKTRALTSPDFLIVFRLSMLDLVPNGSNWNEITQFGQTIEQAGASVINTGIGWHEARIPTIATMVPRAVFADITKRFREHVKIPVVTSNRINTPDEANRLIAEGYADLVSMARPILADSDFMQKTKLNKPEQIKPCIACNQACLDHVFKKKRASCLVNPRAAFELDFPVRKTPKSKKIAVVGSGPAGLSFALEADQQGHEVHLFDKNNCIGGQLNYARKIPGKSEFDLLVDYYHKQIELSSVRLFLNHDVNHQELLDSNFDHIVIATGVTPRSIHIDDPLNKCISYLDVLSGDATIGQNIAIIGTGGIAYDVAEFLLHDEAEPKPDPDHFLNQWGIDLKLNHAGGLVPAKTKKADRNITLLQRSSGKPGCRLGKTTGWIHRLHLKQSGVKTYNNCQYQGVDANGLNVMRGKTLLSIPADQVIICAGQEANAELYNQLQGVHPSVIKIGGADRAGELDAKRAIRQGFELAYNL